jgi:hypothetical protein
LALSLSVIEYTDGRTNEIEEFPKKLLIEVLSFDDFAHSVFEVGGNQAKRTLKVLVVAERCAEQALVLFALRM